jgi:ribosomal protein S27E
MFTVKNAFKNCAHAVRTVPTRTRATFNKFRFDQTHGANKQYAHGPNKSAVFLLVQCAGCRNSEAKKLLYWRSAMRRLVCNTTIMHAQWQLKRRYNQSLESSSFWTTSPNQVQASHRSVKINCAVHLGPKSFCARMVNVYHILASCPAQMAVLDVIIVVITENSKPTLTASS